MIFLTVGSQTPFDRLVKAVDEWVGDTGAGVEVVAQIGNALYRPRHLSSSTTLKPSDYLQACRQADLIVGHAGMGTVLTALQVSRPLLVLPRRGELRETRNDHQLATARWLEGRPGVAVAWDEHQLKTKLGEALRADPTRAAATQPGVSPTLIAALTDFIHSP